MSTDTNAIETFQIPDSLVDDQDVARDETYTDPVPRTFLQDAGNYRFTVVKSRLKPKSKTDPTLYLRDGKYPSIEIQQIRLVSEDPALNGRNIYLYQEFNTKPMDRKKGGQVVTANELSDLLGSHSTESTHYKGLRAGLDLFKGLAETGAEFAGYFDWEADDYKGANAALTATANARGLADAKDLPKDIANEIRYDRFKQRGQRLFLNEVTQTFDQTWVSPSGTEVPARLRLREFIPSSRHDKTTWGPAGFVRAAAAKRAEMQAQEAAA